MTPFEIIARYQSGRFSRDEAMMEIKALVLEERQRCARIAQHATIPPYSVTLHPEIPFDRMNETARLVAHMTAQAIVVEIIRAEG